MQAQEHVYYEVTIPNGYQEPNYPDIDAQSVDSRSAPILASPSQYELSIVRMFVPGGSIPLKVMEMWYNALNPADVQSTIYTLQLVGPSNSSSVRRLTWDTENATARVPSNLVPGVTLYPEYVDYYSMFSAQSWCDMLNAALAYAYSQLVGVTVGNPPFITYDGQTEKFTLWRLKANTVMGILFNAPLANVFGSTFPNVHLGGGVYRIDINNTGVNQSQPAGIGAGTTDYLFLQQEYTNINSSDFTSLQSIFVTSDLGVRLQLIPNYVSNSIIRSSANQQRNVLTNFGITNGNVRQDIAYVPTAEYRRMEVLNSSAIYSVNIGIFWQDHSGNVYPIRIPAGKSANLLLLFERK